MVVLYIKYATSSKEKTGHIITFVQLEEGKLLLETCTNTKGGNESDGGSTLVNISWRRRN